MWFDGQRQPNTIYVANISRGKDSTAMLRAIQLMGWPLDMICAVDIWFDEETPAELPPMVAFKDEYDKKVLDWFGIPVYRPHASKGGKKITYTDLFYRQTKNAETRGFPIIGGNWCPSDLKRAAITGFPHQCGPWCNSRLKERVSRTGNTKCAVVNYIGIAADEPERISKWIGRKNKVLPLVQIGWDEALCGLEAQYMDMLSPTYSDGQFRDGCWFCHNQGVDKLRRLRRNYPDLWSKLMKLDLDSPVTFRADGHTVHDFDQRFALEDMKLLFADDKVFRWASLESELNYRLF